MSSPSDNYERLLTKRAILSALGPLAGTRATGNVTATASSASVTLPPFTYGVPIIGGKAPLMAPISVFQRDHRLAGV